MTDRGMIKWQPFNAVASGNYMVNEVLRKKNKLAMPSLSEDQQNEIQNKILDSFQTQEVVKIKYYKNGRIYNEEGIIEQIDRNNHNIILNNGQKVFFAQIIEIC